MTNNVDSFTASEWIQVANTESTRRTRQTIASTMARSNGFQTPDQVIEAIKGGALSVYVAGRKFVDALIVEKRQPSTIAYFTTMAKTFFEAMDVPVKKVLWLQRVRQVKRAIAHAKGNLTREQLSELLTHAETKVKAEVAFLLSTGWRREEITRVRLEDVDWNIKPVRVKLWAVDPVSGKANKTGQPRVSFLSTEAVRLIQVYLKTRTAGSEGEEKPEYLFGGISDQAIYKAIMKALKGLGLTTGTKVSNGKTFYDIHPHTFRSLNLAISKQAGLSPDWAEALCGHDTGTQGFYHILDRVAEDWQNKVDPQMVFTGEREKQIIVPDPKNREDIEKLTGILEVLIGKGAVDSLMSKSLDQFRKDKTKVLAQQAQLEDNSGQGRVEGESK